MDRFTGWIASLSDGSEIMETPIVQGEPSSWQKLLKKSRETGVRVTMLRLMRGGATITAMPVKACDGYYQAYESIKSLFTGKESSRQGIGSVVGSKVYITWVNDFGNVWQDVRELSREDVHTTVYKG